MKQVILAEKPSQAKAYANAFDNSSKENGYYQVSANNFENAIITYGFGHLVELYAPEDYKDDWKQWNINTLPIQPEQYHFKVSKDKKKQYNIVKQHLDEADEIIVATDSDREGEAIARLIIRLSGNADKPIKRLWINSLETDEIKKGFQNLKDGQQFYPSFIEAESRQIADWLVGINLSRLYTLYMQQNGMDGVFSIGRVQTPTLYLIYQRNQEIANFVKKPFYELYGHFTHENGTYKGKYAKRFDTEEELIEFKDQHQLSDGSSATISSVEKETKRKHAPKLFSLSDLQSVANKKFNMSANDTLKIAQNLYEKQVTSYPRTDSNYIGTPEFNYLKAYLDRYLELANSSIEHKQLDENKRYVNGKKVQEHYAIIPTKTLPDLQKLSDKERQIYELILYRTLAIFEEPYEYEETTLITTANQVDFKTTGKVELNKGWQRLYKDDKDTKDNEDEQELPDVRQGDSVESTFEHKKGETQPPKYYTEGTLLTAMKHVSKTIQDQDDNEEMQDILKETEGIGTEATRASIIENLKYKKYITTKGKKLIVTEKGTALCEIIADDPISNAEMTAKWEKYLKSIQQQKGTQQAFLESINNFIDYSIKHVPENFKNSDIEQHAHNINQDKVVGTCPNCQHDLVDKGKFYGCSNYPECAFTLSKYFRKKKLTKTNIKQLLTDNETIIKGIKAKSGNKYNAKVTLNDKNFIDFVDFAQ